VNADRLKNYSVAKQRSNIHLHRLISGLTILLFVFPLYSQSSKFHFKIPDFVSDTLTIDFPVDSLPGGTSVRIRATDVRPVPGNLLTIQQTKVWKVIPVDQFVTTARPLASLLDEQFQKDSLQFHGTLRLVQFHLWTDMKPVFEKGRRINAYTILVDSTGKTIGDWLWQISGKKQRKEKDKQVIQRLVNEWCQEQSAAIRDKTWSTELYPYLYRRQLLTWMNVIYFTDGYSLDGHLTLDFPPGRESRWIRGSTGLYYRKGAHHESIGFTGANQTRYKRFNRHLIGWISGTYRFGFNNFERSTFPHLNSRNLIFLQLAAQASLEYHPVYHKGLYAGIGIFQGMTILPDILDPFETGLSMTLGVALP